ncbi:hypothetical protein G4G28_14895 [Massilia sp. Dwa41.01b]|nr:hypothetical protein G4G28_14895 [Massilia sp. Dwa41.01b]
MRNVFLLAAIAAALGGCGQALFDDGIKTAVRGRLKDPDSAKWGEIIQYKNFACIKYNAKNSYGGYGGSSWAVLERNGDSWDVRHIDRESCDESHLAHLAEPINAPAKKAVLEAVLAAFKKKQLIDASITDESMLPHGPCRTLIGSLRSYANAAIDADNKEERANWKSRFDAEFKKIDSMKCS